MAATEQAVSELLQDPAELSKQFVGSVYERFDTALRGFFMNKLRNEAEAEDFAQEVYLRFARLEDPGKIRSDRAFLFTTATDIIYHHCN